MAALSSAVGAVPVKLTVPLRTVTRTFRSDSADSREATASGPAAAPRKVRSTRSSSDSSAVRLGFKAGDSAVGPLLSRVAAGRSA